jgi:septin family protein
MNLSRFLVAANLNRALHHRTTSELFHQTLQDKFSGDTNATMGVQGTLVHEQNRVQTVAALNDRGFMLGGLYGSTQFQAHKEHLAQLQQQQGTKDQAVLDKDASQERLQAETDRYHQMQQLIIQRREEIRHALERQYTDRNASENKSNFSYSFSMKK